MKKILVFLILFIFPFIARADNVYKEVKSIEELTGNQKIVLVFDGNTFEFVDILKNPVNSEVAVQDGYLLTEVGINNIFNINSSDSSLSDDTLKIKPLVIGDTSVTCSKNNSCKKGNLYLKDNMFHYQDKEIKIQEISEGLFSVRSDNTHYLNYDNGSWIISSNVQGFKIYHEIEEDVNQDEITEIDNEFYIDDILIIGQTSKDSIKEKNNSFVNIHLYYDNQEVKQTKLNFKYENSNTVDMKIKFVDKYNDDLYSNYYDYLISDEYLSSDYLLTRVYSKQDSSYSIITNNGINFNGGILDNVLGESDVHIYVSSKYSAEYYKDKEKLELGSNDKYYINPDSYTIPSGYEDAVDSKVLESVNYVDPKGIEEFVYNVILNDYESSFYLPDNEYKMPWFLNGKKIFGEFDVASNIADAENKVFKFIFYVVVENPNTTDMQYILLIILLGVGVIVSILCVKYLIRRNYEQDI